jgi:hypothetical protein
MTCDICGADPCINPSFCRVCRDADQRKAKGERPKYETLDRPINWSDSPRLTLLRRLMDPAFELSHAWAALNDINSRPTPRATIEAVMHAVRERGIGALKEPATAERLARCDTEARAEINRQIEKPELQL